MNPSRTGMLANGNVAYWLARRAAIHPRRTAIVYCHQPDSRETWTFEELDGAARRLCRWLRDSGIGAGDRVAFHDQNDVRFIITLFAVAYLGAVFVPLNFRLSGVELADMLGDCDARLLIHGAGFDEHRQVVARHCPELRYLRSDRDTHDEFGAAIDAAQHADVRVVELPWTEPAWLLYTSGSTGQPKGVVLTHGNLFWNALNTLLIQGGLPADRLLISAPLFHAAPVSSFMETFFRGATVHLERSFDAGRLLQRVASERITVVAGVPTMYTMMAQHPGFADADLSALRSIIVGGAPVSQVLIDTYRARGVAVIQRYGQTEAAPLVTGLPLDAPEEKWNTAGLPGLFVEMRIADEDHAGIGQIEARGPNIMQGYWRRDDDTRAALRDGWLRTGDLGRVDEAGYLKVVGRSKDMIISGGENVYAGEVEAKLAAVPGLSEVAVIGIPHEKWGEAVCAIVSRRVGAKVEARDVLACLDGQLARYKLPSRVVFVDALPKNGAGKIDKVTLRRTYAQPA